MKTLFNQPYACLIIGCLLAASGQLLLKSGANSANQIHELINIRTTSGIIFYAIGMLLWIIALAKIDLHIAYAFTAITFLLVYAGSAIILNENIPMQALVGAALITIGIFIIASSNNLPPIIK